MRFGLIIVTLALMGAIFAGSMAIETESHVKTEYERISDLAPIVTYSDVDSTIQYNPITNVTGWTNANYTTQHNPSIYTITPPTNYNTITSNTLGDMGGNYYPTGAAYGAGSDYAYGGQYPLIVWNDTPIGTVPTTDEERALMGWNARDIMIGGISSAWLQTGYNVQSLVTVGVRQGTTGTINYQATTAPYYWQDLTRVATAENWTTGTVVNSYHNTATGGPVGIAKYLGITFDGQYLQRVAYQDPNGTPGQTIVYWRTSATEILNINWIEDTAFWWNNNTKSFYTITGYDGAGYPIVSKEPTALVWITHSLTDTLTLTVWENSGIQYIVPNTDVQINAGTVGSWANGYDNERLQMIVTPNAGLWFNGQGPYYLPDETQIYDRVLITIEKNRIDSYWQGITEYNSLIDYTVLDYQRPLFNPVTRYVMGGDSYECYTPEIWPISVDNTKPPASLAYPYNSIIEITLHSNTGGSYTITPPNSYTDGTNYAEIYKLQTTNTLTYTQPLGGGNYQYEYWDFTPITDGPITSIGVTSWNNNTHAAIVNTWIKADPNGLLWGNPSMDIGQYFADVMADGARITFGSVLSTGTALNIFGQSFDTADNKILIDGALYPINGLSIDVKGSAVSILSNGATITEYEKTTNTITGAGVWMWSAAMYKAYNKVVEEVTIDFGEGSSKDWMIFTFIGICITGLVVFIAWGRGNLDFWDWVVILISAFIGVLML